MTSYSSDMTYVQYKNHSPEVVRCESLPEREESLVLGNLQDDVCGSFVLRLAVDNLHVLDPGGRVK